MGLPTTAGVSNISLCDGFWPNMSSWSGSCIGCKLTRCRIRSNGSEQLLHKFLDLAADPIVGERITHTLARPLELLAFLKLDVCGHRLRQRTGLGELAMKRLAFFEQWDRQIEHHLVEVP